jgi:hypothetical protein
MSKCEEKLIADHKDVLIGDFQNLLDFDKDEGLLHTIYCAECSSISQ